MRNSLLIAFLFVAFIELKAQVIPIDTVLNRIEREHVGLNAYKQRIKGIREMVKTAPGWMPAMVGVEAGRFPYPGSMNSNGTPLMFFAQQDFPAGKGVKAKRDYLTSLTDVEQFNAGALKNQLFAEAKLTYFQRYIAERKIKVLNESIRLMKAMIDISQKQIAVGMTELPAVYQLRAKLAETETMLVHETNLVRMYTVTLNYLMNRNLNDTFHIDTTKIFKDYRFASFFQDSIQYRRSDIKKMSSEIYSMNLNQILTASQSRPSLGVRYEHHTDKFQPMGYIVMLQMRVPFVPWVSKAYKAEANAMKYNISALDMERQNMINKTNQTIKGLIIELESEYAEVDNYEKKVIPSYRRSVEVSLLSYSQNTNDIMMTLLAWEGLQMAQMEYLDHLGVLLSMQTEYEKELEIR